MMAYSVLRAQTVLFLHQCPFNLGLEHTEQLLGKKGTRLISPACIHACSPLLILNQSRDLKRVLYFAVYIPFLKVQSIFSPFHSMFRWCSTLIPLSSGSSFFSPFALDLVRDANEQLAKKSNLRLQTKLLRPIDQTVRLAQIAIFPYQLCTIYHAMVRLVNETAFYSFQFYLSTFSPFQILDKDHCAQNTCKSLLQVL